MPQPETKVRRRVRLIKPTLQLKLCVVFLSVAVACILVQFTLWSGTLAEISARDPRAATILGPALWRHLGITLTLLVPLTLSVGILVTHKIAGPVYRFEQYLGALSNGEDPGICKIRDGDELVELCDTINCVAEYLREIQGSSSPERQVMMGTGPVANGGDEFEADGDENPDQESVFKHEAEKVQADE